MIVRKLLIFVLIKCLRSVCGRFSTNVSFEQKCNVVNNLLTRNMYSLVMAAKLDVFIYIDYYKLLAFTIPSSIANATQ